MFNFTFKNKTTTEMGCEVVERPSIPTAEKNIVEQAVPGRNGSLFYDYGTFKTINITISLNFKAEINEWHQRLSELKSWLSGSNEILRLSDMPGEFYKVNSVKLTDTERTGKRVGSLSAVFNCEPFKYTDEGENLVENPSTMINEGLESNPLYIISGEGPCNLTVNGNVMAASLGMDEMLYIDVEREIAYVEGEKLVNSAVSGEYEDIKLKNGSNSIEITEGFDLLVKPRWRRL